MQQIGVENRAAAQTLVPIFQKIGSTADLGVAGPCGVLRLEIWDVPEIKATQIPRLSLSAAWPLSG